MRIEGLRGDLHIPADGYASMRIIVGAAEFIFSGPPAIIAMFAGLPARTPLVLNIDVVIPPAEETPAAGTPAAGDTPAAETPAAPIGDPAPRVGVPPPMTLPPVTKPPEDNGG